MITYFFSGKILAVYIFMSLLFGAFLLKRTEGRYRFLQGSFIIIFIVYLYFVIKITQFPIFQTENMKAVLSGHISSSINLVPFKDIFSLTSLYNIILTIPFGFLVPILKRSAMNIRSVILMVILPGLLIEIGQFVQLIVIGYTLRIVDINDIMCNSAGVISGYIILQVFKMITGKISDHPIAEFINKSKITD